MRNFALSALLTIGLGVITASPSVAVALTPVQSGGASSNVLLQDVATRSHHHQMRRSWDRHRDGARCRYRTGHCRHYHHGYWYANPWWTLPLIGGSIILNTQHHHSVSLHVAWCEDHYRSYNRRTNTWIAYSGAVRRCVSPYGR